MLPITPTCSLNLYPLQDATNSTQPPGSHLLNVLTSRQAINTDACLVQQRFKAAGSLAIEQNDEQIGAALLFAARGLNLVGHQS